MDTKNLFTKRLCQKLKNCRADPYAIKQVISAQAIELNLPDNTYGHFVFHVNLLEPVATDSHFDYIQLPLSSIEVNGEEKWKVKTIIDLRYIGHSKKLRYCIK